MILSLIPALMPSVMNLVIGSILSWYQGSAGLLMGITIPNLVPGSLAAAPKIEVKKSLMHLSMIASGSTVSAPTASATKFSKTLIKTASLSTVRLSM
jgi:hypothetical protein